MGLRSSRRDRALERRLRDERPVPRAELVHLLSVESAPPRPRRRFVPGLVLAAALTALVAGSIGAAGAMGSACRSVVSLSESVYHVVSPSRSPHGGPWREPFGGEYGDDVPICDAGRVIETPVGEYLWRLLHGDRPAAACEPRR